MWVPRETGESDQGVRLLKMNFFVSKSIEYLLSASIVENSS